MKKTKFLFNKITDIFNLHNAYYKASKRKRTSVSYLYFRKYDFENLKRIQEQLVTDTFVFGKYNQFQIHDPKERTITAASFEERIVHHAIINVLEEVFEKQLIFHTYACRKNKGTHAAIKYVQKQCLHAKYFLKLDVRKYFDNINHSILKASLEHIIADKKCLDILGKIIDSYSVSKNKGIPIGNLTSQYFANYYLSALDHFILEKLHPISYVRYMDDFLIFDSDIQRLRGIYSIVSRFCKLKLNLELKPPIYGNCNSGIPFLGTLIKKDIIVLLQEKEKLKKKKIKQIDYLLRTEKISQEKAIERITAILEGIEYWKRL